MKFICIGYQMAKHRVYRSIVQAVNEGRLKEPFNNRDFRSECPGFAGGTYNVFLHKHALGNPGGNSELFKRISPGKFRLIRPFKYGL